MPSKSKEARLDQRSQLEDKLNQRLAELRDKGEEASRIPQDPKVKMLRADLRKTTERLKAIEAKGKKADELAERKAAKASASKEEKGKKQKDSAQEPSMSKRQQKKREKMEKKQGKDQNA